MATSVASEKVTCVVWREGNREAPCGAPADVEITVACLHEHVSTADMCNEHLASLTHPFCRLCKDLPEEGHYCHLAVKITKYHGPTKMDDHSMEK
jgi:hypothetical protein